MQIYNIVKHVKYSIIIKIRKLTTLMYEYFLNFYSVPLLRDMLHTLGGGGVVLGTTNPILTRVGM